MSAYRDDHDALLSQCDALRGELATAREGSEELTRIQTELEGKLAELSASRLTDAEKGMAAKRLTMRGVRMGFLLSALVASGIFGYLSLRADSAESRATSNPAANNAAADNSAAGWFAQTRPHCNPVEVSVFLKDNIPPGGEAGTPYKAACFALAGKFEDARRSIDSLQPGLRPAAAHLVFNVVHPIADAGDDMAAGPVMEFVLEYTPNNFMALYHAGMSAYGEGDKERARRRLREFLALYSEDNFFTQTAVATLSKLGSQPEPQP